MDEQEDVIEIANYPYLHLAEFAASVLEGSGVDCFLGDQFVAGVRPEIIFTSGGVKLFVRRADAERALDVLAELETSLPEEPISDEAGV